MSETLRLLDITSLKSRGGGVLIAVDRNLISHALEPVHSNIEHIFVRIKTTSAIVENQLMLDLINFFDLKQVNNVLNVNDRILDLILTNTPDVMPKTKNFKDVRSLKTLYRSLVRPLLEFSSTVWSPYYSVYIKAIEKIQHRFLRRAKESSKDLVKKIKSRSRMACTVNTLKVVPKRILEHELDVDVLAFADDLKIDGSMLDKNSSLCSNIKIKDLCYANFYSKFCVPMRTRVLQLEDGHYIPNRHKEYFSVHYSRQKL
ncbi:hypothetical protein J437_LFUL016355 [Ladona fulva]|uniref:Uncharacterized protein n=1 Tax=Ladona fulva TaxID=123851 RepID=A0A8K0KIZ4_LADFU|nr:hypothetical protein J437_LFUL016355 [Ladona fulva]